MAAQSGQPTALRPENKVQDSGFKSQVPLFPTNLLPGSGLTFWSNMPKTMTGKMWIQWVGNERVFLGKMPYPWEFYGKYLYTEFVPLFDIISAIGDSILGCTGSSRVFTMLLSDNGKTSYAIF